MKPLIQSHIDDILKEASFSVEEDIIKNAHLVLKDMNAGLDKSEESSLAMFHSKLGRSSINVKELKMREKLIALDLGGSNLRVALISFEDESRLQIDDVKKQKCEKEYESSRDFFTFIAKSIEHLKGKSNKIVFCFSYALEFVQGGQAIVRGLSKDLSVPDIENKNVGEELIKALKMRGWSGVESVFVTNDTVATLFAGLYQNIQNKNDHSCNSLMSIILGTGLNAAYFDEDENDIIILEAGAFDKISMSDFDANVIMKSKENAHHILEKQCSAHYLGSIASEIFKLLIERGVFSKEAKSFIEGHRRDFSNWVFLNDFFSSSHSILLEKFDVMFEKNDLDVILYVVKNLIARVANLISSLIVAIAMKMKKEKTVKLSAMIEGSTILKTYGMLELVKQGVAKSLVEIGGVEVEFVTYEHATLIGCAILGRGRKV